MKRLLCVLVILLGCAQSQAGETAVSVSAPDSKAQQGPCTAPVVSIPAQDNEQMLAVDWLQQFTRDGYGDDPEKAPPGKLSACAECWRKRAQATAEMYRLRGVDTATLLAATEKAADVLAELAKNPPSVKTPRSPDVMEVEGLMEDDDLAELMKESLSGNDSLSLDVMEFEGLAEPAKKNPSVKVSRSSDVMKDKCLAELARKTQPGSATSVYLELRRRVRNLALADGRLLPRKLLFYKRRNGIVFGDINQITAVWAGSPGGDIYVGVLGQGGVLTELHPLIGGRLPTGHVHGIDLHWDGQRIVFGYVQGTEDFSARWSRPGHDAWLKSGPGFVHEMRLDGSGLRQITRGERSHDVAPVYLPDGGVAFCSDRNMSGVQCNQPRHDELFANLYACRMDGSGLFRLVNNANGDYNPRVLDDGRIAFLRWEYNERMFVHSLWSVRPDGTYCEPLYAQHLGPGSLQKMVVDARSIPGSDRLIAIAGGHYNNERGVVAVIDPRHGPADYQRGIRTLPEGLPLWAPLRAPTRQKHGFYAYPWALNEEQALCSYEYRTDQSDPAGYGLYLIDRHGNQELIHRDPVYACLMPIPVQTRPVPPALPVMRTQGVPAVCALMNVYAGADFLKPGEAKYLRISENGIWPYTVEDGQMRYRFADNQCENYTAKRIVGDVPIEKDGSACFTVPADRPLYFQLLDGQRREIRRMRSWVSFQPGERRSCVGCHETQATATAKMGGAVAMALRQPPVTPRPAVSWQDKCVNYLRDIQPILDRHCAGCHAGTKPAGGWDFSGGLTAKYNISYEYMFGYRSGTWSKDYQVSKDIKFPLLAAPARLDYTYPSLPRHFGSTQAVLFKVLEEPRHMEWVKLAEQEQIDLAAWIDLNGPYHDRCFSKRKPRGFVPGASAKNAEIFARRCAGCHAPKSLDRPDWADIRAPQQSRFLTAPLAKGSGGSERCGQAVFQDLKDPDYQTLLTWAQESARRVWTEPRHDVRGLIEAGQTPTHPGGQAR